METRTQPFPIFDIEKCSECQACVYICPTSAIRQIAGFPSLKQGVNCTACGLCEDACPSGAISVPFSIHWSK